MDFPCKIDDQYVFLRFFVREEGTFIKVEVLQNFQRLDSIEVVDELKLLTVKNVGLLKLMSCSNRASQKDIYDIDFITDHVSLGQLFILLKEKKKKYSDERYRTIFGLDEEKSPTLFPELLIKFDEVRKASGSRPSHSHDRIDIVAGSKTWRETRYSWLRKVSELFREMDIPYPRPKGLDLN